MPTCQNCEQKWSWKQTFKRSFTLDTGMTCPYCEKKQYVTSRARKKTTVIPFIIVALIMISNILFGPSFVFVSILIGLIPLFLGLYPFWVELSNKEESLW